MVRRNLLEGLMEAPAPAPAAPRAETGTPGRPAGGAIGAVSQGIAELRARAVIDIEPSLIDPGGFADRLGEDADDHARLVASIRDHGQQVPVLVRPHPDAQGRYQVVYGRRRVRAAGELGIAVKAMVRDLDDRDLVLAQGQENTARRDLSFIEKANFARQMVAAGFKRKIVCAALSIDKTGISRMLAVAEAVPEEVIRAIGPAPGIGRERWQKLAGLMARAGTPAAEAARLAAGARSDERFEAVLAALTPARAQKPRPRDDGPLPEGAGKGPMMTAAGRIIGRVHDGPEQVVLTLEDPDGFGRWLRYALPTLYCAWLDHADQWPTPEEILAQTGVAKKGR